MGLHKSGQVKEIDLLPLGQRLKSQVWIENAIGADMLQKLLSNDRVWIDLDCITQCDQIKPGFLLRNTITYLLDQSFGDSPGLLPIFIPRLDINHIVDADVFGVSYGR